MIKLLNRFSMKFYPRLNIWKSSTGALTYNPETKEAYSYRWYCLAKKYNKRGMVLNTYSYSVSTARHVRNMRQFFIENGIKYTEIEAPRGLQDLEAACMGYQHDIYALQAAIEKKGSRKATNEERKEEIKRLIKKIQFIYSLEGAK